MTPPCPDASQRQLYENAVHTQIGVEVVNKASSSSCVRRARQAVIDASYADAFAVALLHAHVRGRRGIVAHQDDC